MKILLAVDGSPTTRRMLAYVAAHDEWLGVHHEYTVLHALPALPRRAAAALDKATVARYQAEAAEKVFKPVRTFFARQGLQAKFVSRVGAPAEVVAAAAEAGQDLLMLGSHGHGNLANLLLGSVATGVLARCRTPALLIR